MDHLLSDRVIAITGAFGDLGEALANLFAGCNARLVLIDSAPCPLPSSPTVLVLPRADLSVAPFCQDIVEHIEKHFGRLDALVNIIGSVACSSLPMGDRNLAKWLYGVHLRTVLNISKAALPLLRQSPAGRIVNIGSGVAARAGQAKGVYGATKAAVLNLTEDLAEELKGQRITVNAVLSSVLDTPQNRAAMPGAEYGRWVAPEQLCSVILFLLSEAAAQITGAGVLVSGRA
ncbi:SDR family oxidoreductase [Enterobacterales bacterium AE_CKDN230030158-1A_HGKHYDSX7]